MLENTKTKQFYPGPILNSTLEITEFLFTDPAQIKVTKTSIDDTGTAIDIELEYGVEYEVTKVLSSDINAAEAALTASTGQVKLKNISVGDGEKLTVYRKSDLIQDVQYPRTGAFPAASHEGALDYLTMQNQEQQDQIDRALKVPISTQNFTGDLPIPVPARALKINAEGTGFEMSEYDPDTALVTTREYMEAAQTAATNASTSETNASTSEINAADSVSAAQAIITTGQTNITNIVNEGQSSIESTIEVAEITIDQAIQDATASLNTSIQDFKTYMNENPYSGKTIGEVFWTLRTDEINGAYNCNSQEFTRNTFEGTNNPYDLLLANKLPNKTYEEYQQMLEEKGYCPYFAIDQTNQKFKVPKLNPIVIQGNKASVIGNGIALGLTNGSADFGMAGIGSALIGNEETLKQKVSTTASYNKQYATGNVGISTNPENSGIEADLSSASVTILRPMVQLATSATEVSFADYATQFTNALNQAVNTLSASGQEYLQDLTPNKFLRFSNHRRLTITKDTYLKLDTQSTATTLWYINTIDTEVEIETLLDTGSTLQAGKPYSIFLVPNAAGTGVELKVSLNSTAPTGYSPGDTRRIGGFSTMCVNVGTVSWYTNHPLSGWLAGDIIPNSVWTIYHRPYASPNNCIYIPVGQPFWRTIYDHAGTLNTTSFEYGATITRTRDYYGHVQDLSAVGYMMPTYQQAALSGVGCEALKAVMGKAEASITTAGGHINESSHRIVSIYGAEDCVGCTWKMTTIAAIGGSGWSAAPNSGVYQYGSVNVLLVGGHWDFSGYAGPFATYGNDSALTANSTVASFGVSYPLPRKSEGNV